MTLGYPFGERHQWFAWRPVWVEDAGLRWLCWVNRQRCYMPDWDEPWEYWEYTIERA